MAVDLLLSAMFMNNIFQPKNYFKGWYFKCNSQNQTVTFIPAFHRNNGRESASLQIITDEAAFHIPFHSLIYREKPLSAKLGDCIFYSSSHSNGQAPPVKHTIDSNIKERSYVNL